jgi:hypothetical protein
LLFPSAVCEIPVMPVPDGPAARAARSEPVDPLGLAATAAAPTPERTADVIGRLHACAFAVRAAADTIERRLDEVRAYDRDDVWQGGRATTFRDGLRDQIAVLTSANVGATTRLRDAARRIDARADAVQAEADAATRAELRAAASIDGLPW